MTVNGISNKTIASDDTLFKNSNIIIINSVVGSVFGFLFWIVVTRLYSPNDVGLTAALLSAISIITCLANFGFSNSVIRFLPGEKDVVEFINSSLTTVAIITVLVSLIFLGTIDVWASKLGFINANIIYVPLFILYVIASTLNPIVNSIFIATRDTKYNIIQNFVMGILKLSLPFLMIQFAIYGIINAWGISLLVSVLLSLYLLRRVVHSYSLCPSINLSILKKVYKFTTGTYLANMFEYAPSLIIPIILLNLLTPDANAYYYIAFSIVSILFVIPASLSSSLFAEGSGSEDSFQANLIKVVKRSYILLIPLVIFIVFFGDKILMLFGPGYSAYSYDVLVLLAVSCLFQPLYSFYIIHLQLALKIKKLIIMDMLVSLLMILLSYLLIPYFGLISVGFAFIVPRVLVSIYAAVDLFNIGRGQRLLAMTPQKVE